MASPPLVDPRALSLEMAFLIFLASLAGVDPINFSTLLAYVMMDTLSVGRRLSTRVVRQDFRSPSLSSESIEPDTSTMNTKFAAGV